MRIILFTTLIAATAFWIGRLSNRYRLAPKEKAEDQPVIDVEIIKETPKRKS